MNDKRMSDGPDWTFDLLNKYQDEIAAQVSCNSCPEGKKRLDLFYS